MGSGTRHVSCVGLPVIFVATAVTRHRSRFSRPPVGAVWGWAQTAAGRAATDRLLPGGALVISPHQDDETIGCGLLMAEKANGGFPVTVAVATDGHAGWHSAKPRPTAREIAEIRHHEWHRALDILGVPQGDRVELGFPDGALTDHENELTEELCGLLQRLRPSQVFVTKPGDPHADHRTLARAVRRSVEQLYGPGPGNGSHGFARSAGLRPVEVRPKVFSYRVYPREGLWSDAHPGHVPPGSTGPRLVRSIVGLTNKRPLLFRAPEAAATKVAAIDAYDSQARLLEGELRYVWGTAVELYWRGDEGSDHESDRSDRSR
jgi:LmbE family N-acetylglucosaminyl deacetylase